MRSLPSLIAGAVGYVVSLVAAVAYFAAKGWFGVGDLRAFAFWSVPFALLLALTAPRLHPWLTAQSTIRRSLAALVTGVLLGACWTLALAVGMGAWVAAFSLPILHVWALGGVAALFALLAAPAPAPPAHPRAQGRPRWRLMLWIIGVPLGSVAVVAALWFGSLFGSMYLWDRAEPELHRIPVGYVGPVVIIFNQADGAPVRYEGKRRVYDIPPTGVLRTQFALNEGWSAPEYLYVGAQGRTSPIVRGAPCEDSLPAQTVQACLMGRMWINGQTGADYSAYVVGPTGDQRRLYEQGDSMVRAVIFGEQS